MKGTMEPYVIFTCGVVVGYILIQIIKMMLP